ncbi:hypothetical protein EMPS_01317 [Entomortierella parvispora]|uniref:PH domain-containing protein n=1 Tax=Entomortierella parvispora TaxID=205924 RepID=A0A9P3H2L0_9FUNG|nr:hypothetical protein EMPS_01317 [Entomortierella parvispora]
MQNDTFKRFSKDLQGALSLPAHYLSKQVKKSPFSGGERKKDAMTAHRAVKTMIEPSSPSSAISDSTLENNISRINTNSSGATTSSLSTNNTNLPIGNAHNPTLGQFLRVTTRKSGRRGSMIETGRTGGYKSPQSPGSGKIFTKEEPPIMHFPSRVSSMDQFSDQRQAWIHKVLNTEPAWEHRNGQYRSPVEAHDSTGLFLVRLMQVTNKASTKIFDVEWNLRVGSQEGASHPSRSFKDNPGNTATMNEVFMFEVNDSFQLDITVLGNPVVTKFGTMAGFCNNQTVNLGSLGLSFCLESMEKSIHTYRLTPDSAKSSIKTDCEVVVMVAMHIAEEPEEDMAWETETLHQGFLTMMTRGGRSSSWKRYWAVLEGRAIKLYDAEYQLQRDVISVLPLAHITGVQPPDYEKVDVGANGMSLVVDPHGMDPKTGAGVRADELDYCMYAFSDSAQSYEVWNAHLEEALGQYQFNMARRMEVQKSRAARQARQSLSRQSFESSVPPTPLEGLDERLRTELIDMRYVW